MSSLTGGHGAKPTYNQTFHLIAGTLPPNSPVNWSFTRSRLTIVKMFSFCVFNGYSICRPAPNYLNIWISIWQPKSPNIMEQTTGHLKLFLQQNVSRGQWWSVWKRKANLFRLIFFSDSSRVVDCPTQLTLIFVIVHVFRDKYQSDKYEKHGREICPKSWGEWEEFCHLELKSKWGSGCKW